MRNVFGPVPSRRLGMSLGVDMVPYKTCSFDCVYCECGSTTVKETLRRPHFDSLGPVLDEIGQVLNSGRRLDYITLGGSGEPTLNAQCGELIRAVKGMTDIPVAVLTNGSLLTQDDVFRELLLADVVVPSLDSARQTSFETVNRPAPGLSIEAIGEAIGDFVRAFRGDVWLEVLLVDGLNDSEQDLRLLARAVRRIDPVAVQVGTVERPGTEAWARPVSDAVLSEAIRLFGPKAAIIGQPQRGASGSSGPDVVRAIVDLLSRRPCTIEDLESSTSAKRPILMGKLRELEAEERIRSYVHRGKKFYAGVRRDEKTEED